MFGVFEIDTVVLILNDMVLCPRKHDSARRCRIAVQGCRTCTIYSDRLDKVCWP